MMIMQMEAMLMKRCNVSPVVIIIIIIIIIIIVIIISSSIIIITTTNISISISIINAVTTLHNKEDIILLI